MIFNSFTYIIFLIVVITLYWSLPRTPRLLMLVVCDVLFYGFWRFDFVVIMIASASADYISGLKISASTSNHSRRLWLAFSLCVNFGMLFYFKYAMFFLSNINGIAHLFGYGDIARTWSILLPIGISFYTFHTTSYVIDVYRRRIEPVREPLVYAIFVSFFPQLVAGPILRANEVVWQLEQRPLFRLTDLTLGGWLILNGLFLKCVLADNIATLVDEGFSANTSTLSALDVWVLAFLFGFQIYFDFSAYSHIAIGTARLMGISFPTNFWFPYMATSPRDFWRRWHISLSSWIRDYLYLPLCGVRPHDISKGGLVPVGEQVSELRRNAALIATWAIMGFWHGANWTFIAWGLWHAALILIHRMISQLGILHQRPNIAGSVGWALTIPFIMLGWIFFRAANLSQAFEMLEKLLHPANYLVLSRLHSGNVWSALPINIEPMSFLAVAALTIGMLGVYWVRKQVWPRLNERPAIALPASLIYGTIVVAMVFVYLRPARQFIYFQF